MFRLYVKKQFSVFYLFEETVISCYLQNFKGYSFIVSEEKKTRVALNLNGYTCELILSVLLILLGSTFTLPEICKKKLFSQKVIDK